MDVPDEALIKRISGRRVCRECGAISQRPFRRGTGGYGLPECGSEIYQRDDDLEETVRKRLEEYAAKTQPLIEYYRREGLLRDVDGDAPLQEVLESIRTILG